MKFVGIKAWISQSIVDCSRPSVRIAQNLSKACFFSHSQFHVEMMGRLDPFPRILIKQYYFDKICSAS